MIPINRAFLTVNRVLLALALGLMLFHFSVYLVYAANLIQFPFDYDQGEGFELVDTIMFSRGQFPYQNVEIFPFYSSNYPPLYHIIPVPFVWLFGPGYWYGRLLSFLSTLVTASAIAYAVYSFDQRRGIGRGHGWIAVLSGLAFLASNFIYHIGPLFRQHISMVMFETLAIVLLAFAPEIVNTRRRRWILALGLAMLILAGYTKQLAAFTAIAALGWLFLRNPRRAIVWGVGFAIVGGAIFLLLTLATNGEWWRQAILANVNQINFPQVEGLFRLWFSLHGALIMLASALVIYEIYFDRLSIYSLWFLVTTVLGGASSGTWGGGDSYFATSIAAMCILSGIFATRTLNRTWKFPENYLSRLLVFPLRPIMPIFSVIALVIIPLFYIAYGWAVIKMPTDLPPYQQIAQLLGREPNADNAFYDSAGRLAGGYADIGHLTTPADIEAGWRIVQMIRETEQPVLSEEAGFVLQAGEQVITNPTQLLNVWLRGLYDGQALIQMIENQEFGLIILRAQFYPEPVLIAIATHYEISETIHMNGFDYIIKRPKPLADATTPP